MTHKCHICNEVLTPDELKKYKFIEYSILLCAKHWCICMPTYSSHVWARKCESCYKNVICKSCHKEIKNDLVCNDCYTIISKYLDI